MAAVIMLGIRQGRAIVPAARRRVAGGALVAALSACRGSTSDTVEREQRLEPAPAGTLSPAATPVAASAASGQAAGVLLRENQPAAHRTPPAPAPAASASESASVAVPAGTVLVEDKPVAVQAFAIDRTEVTTRAYARCVAERECTAAASDDVACNWPRRKARPGYPINCVTFEQAQAFCAWQGGRLPTAAEWTLAAGGPAGREYPWGSAHPSNLWVTTPPAGNGYAPGPARRNLCWVGDGTADGENYPQETCEVGSFPAGNTPSGIADLAGNVAEWTSTTQRLPHGALRYVVKGGAYGFDRLGRLEVAVQDVALHDDEHQAPDVGFRCVSATGERQR